MAISPLVAPILGVGAGVGLHIKTTNEMARSRAVAASLSRARTTPLAPPFTDIRLAGPDLHRGARPHVRNGAVPEVEQRQLLSSTPMTP